jgi:hypothetical protein
VAGLLFLTLFVMAEDLQPTPSVSAADQLFSPSGRRGDSATSTATDRTIKRSRVVDVNFELLPKPKEIKRERGSAKAGVKALNLNLFDDVALTADIQTNAVTASGLGLILTGTVRGHGPLSSVTIVAEGGVMTANIRPTPDKLYQVRYAGNGTHTIREVDQTAFGGDDVGVEVPESALSKPPVDTAADDTDNIIDVLVVYTNGARAQAGGTTAMTNLINLAEAESNQGYANSGVIQRIHVVHTEEVVYTESLSFGTDLNRLVSTNDGIMDNVHALRDTHKADFVTLVRTIDPTGALCGQAAMIFGGTTALTIAGGAPRAFNVSVHDCITGNYTFAHELGHTMGIRHNVQADPSTTPFTYGHGYCAPGGTPGYRDIMGVASSCTPTNLPRLNHWSNPSVTVNGVPSGNSTADSQLALDTTRTLTQNFRVRSGTSGPPNNNFSDATTITGALPQTRTQSTVGATAEANESASCLSVESSVWFSWTAPNTGSVLANTTGSDFDTQLAVFTGSSLGSLNELACNDDIDPDNGNFASQVTFNAIAGTAYRIMVDGYQGAVGNLNLGVSSGATACTSVNVSANPPSPQQVGTQITWTATADGCGSPQYKWWIVLPTGQWALARDWGGPTLVSNTTVLPPGAYWLLALARQTGSTAEYEAFGYQQYQLTAPPGACTSVNLSANPASPQPVGAQITWTATAGGCASAEYLWWYLPPGGQWTLIRDWGTGSLNSNTSVLAPGTYYLAVFARRVGSISAYEASDYESYELTASLGAARTATAQQATAPPGIPVFDASETPPRGIVIPGAPKPSEERPPAGSPERRRQGLVQQVFR